MCPTCDSGFTVMGSDVGVPSTLNRGHASRVHSLTDFVLEFELIQTQMAQKPMLRGEVYARALRASQKRERERMYGWARDASDEWAGRGRVREWEALVWGWRDL